MDITGDIDGGLQLLDAQNGNELPSDNVNISDVLEAVEAADHSFRAEAVAAAVSVVGNMAQPVMPPASVQIIEQPAPKALRFRYECEGRSAGSIPGVHSVPDNKTFPTIRISNYVGQVTIVVSCVTKDHPYRAHPHNLVGREGCERGVCTIRTRISEEARDVQFKNLGIQCVKRRDIADALQARATLRVDPFRHGFEHRNNPQSIDLNAVRLAFQVFLHEAGGQRMYQLPPAVSDIIYDKKAMNDLLIVRASHCSGPVAGGTQIILLCDKVTREDTAVVFYQEDGAGRRVWEQAANTVLVHKQVAMVVETPPYRPPYYSPADHRPQISVQFQLKRLTDKQHSNSVNFEYIPEFQGTARKPPPLALLARLLNNNNNTDDSNDNDKLEPVSSTTSAMDTSVNVSDDSSSVVLGDVNGNPTSPDVDMDTHETSLNELLEQVAELDEIYSESRTRLEAAGESRDVDTEEFDDAGTYTSLQLAFKNPVTIAEPEPAPYEDVQVQTYRGPIIEFSPLKRDPEDSAPPLPPKRVRRPTNTEPFKTSQTSVESVLKSGRVIPISSNSDTPKPILTAARSEPALPPVKKRSFFSRLFRRKDKSPAPSVKSEGKRESKSKPVGRSVSSVSGLRPSKFKSSVSHTSLKDNASGTGLSYADSITHISLHGDDNDKSASQSSLRRPASLAPLPPTDGGTILVAESVLALDASAFKKLQDDLELTDAEHYALYMAVAPHATASEFDDTSCYYSPIDGSKFHS